MSLIAFTAMKKSNYPEKAMMEGSPASEEKV